MADEAPFHLLKKIVNVIVFVLYFSSSLYSAIGDVGFDGHKETYITPARWGFWVWPVIDFLLLGLIIYQFLPAGSKLVIGLINWRFAIIGILNSTFVQLYVRSDYVLAFIFALLTALAISHVYYDIKTKAPPSSEEPGASIVFVHLPFSLWHAYSVVMVVLSLFSAFGVDKYEEAPGFGTKVSVILALAWLSATSIGYALHSEKGDVAGAIVIAWFLAAIFYRQHEIVIHWAAFAAFIITLLSIIKVLVFTYRRRSTSRLIAITDDERAPLVG